MSNKNYGVIASIVLSVVAICITGMVYAAFSQQLDINGSATVKASSWKIKFSNMQTPVKTGTAVAETPTLTDTKVGDYEVTLTTPGDSVSFTFDIVNAGSFDAEISTVTIPTPTCEGTGTNATTDASNVCKNLSYTLTYKDGGATVQNGDALDAGVTRTVVLTLTYSSATDASELPTDDVTVSNLAIPIVYTQS